MKHKKIKNNNEDRVLITDIQNTGYSEYLQLYDSFTLTVNGDTVSNKTVFTQTLNDFTFSDRVNVQGTLSANALEINGNSLAVVAFTGNYYDLLNLPVGNYAQLNNTSVQVWTGPQLFSQIQSSDVDLTSIYDLTNVYYLNNIYPTYPHNWLNTITFDGNHTITGLPLPVDSTDAANKAYVDANVGSGVKSISNTDGKITIDNSNPQIPIIGLNTAASNTWTSTQNFDNGATLYPTPSSSQIHNIPNVEYVNNSGTTVINTLLQRNNTWTGTNAFTGITTAPTAPPGTNTTQIATTAFVKANINPTTNYATQAEVNAGIVTNKAIAPSTLAASTQLAAKAPLVSPALTGTPTAPTPAVTDTTTQVANMAAINNAFNNFTQFGAGAVTQSYLTKVREIISIQDFGAVGDGVTNDTLSVNKLLTDKLQIASGQWKTYAIDAGTVSAATQQCREALFLNNNVIMTPNITPAYFGNSFAANYFGGQLSELYSQLCNPLVQEMGICFIGDSITWGSGATGHAPFEPRNGTLADARDYYKTGSYVNLVKRYVQSVINSTSAVISNYSYSPSGESNVMYITPILLFPQGKKFTYTQTGTSTVTVAASPETVCHQVVKCRISTTVASAVSLSFRLTGSEFELVFYVFDQGSMYEVYVDGELIGGRAYGTATGDDGMTAGTNGTRVHTFDYVHDGLVEIKVVPHPGSIQPSEGLYLEAIRINKTVRVRNQGINGATSASYLLYNFPTSVAEVKFTAPQFYTGLVETAVGTGATSKDTREATGSLTGYQTRYFFLSTSGWEFIIPVNPSKKYFSIAFSSLPSTCGLKVIVGDTEIYEFPTSSDAPGGTWGYGKTRQILLPAGTTEVIVQTVYDTYAMGETGRVYIEGYANYSADDLKYPDNNQFGKGVALDDKDNFCFIQLGTNDRINSPNIIASPLALANNLEKMINLLPRHCVPIIMGAPPALNNSMPTYFDSMRDQVNILVNFCVDNKIDFINNYSIFDNVPFYVFTADGLHPNDLGYKVLASNIINAINNANYLTSTNYLN